MLLVRPAPSATRSRPRPPTWRRTVGPGAMIAVAYVDPGNVGTNVEAGARLGPALLWVVALAALAGMLVQHLSATLGAATGRSLPELCREHYPRPVVRLLWVQGELVAAATDVAEIVGGALALSLLFGVPPVLGATVTAAAGALLLGVRAEGRRHLAAAFAVMLGGLLLAVVFQAWRVGVTAADVARGLVPGLGPAGPAADPDAALLAIGIVGATVMPHVVYLHSALTRSGGAPGSPGRRRRDVVVPLAVATVVNMAVLLVAAAALHVPGAGAVTTTVEGAFAALGRHDASVATVFAGALLVAALGSACVGVHAGDVIMAGFLRRRIPVVLRRAGTLVPALAVLALGLDPTRALVLSQVLLALGLPFALVPLVDLCRRRDLLGVHRPRPATMVAAAALTAAVAVLPVATVMG